MVLSCGGATRWTVDAGSYTVTVGQGGDGGNGATPGGTKSW